MKKIVLLLFISFCTACHLHTHPTTTLYGITAVGGDDDIGTIFKINNDGTGFKVLHSFNWATGGWSNGNSLVLGPNGKLYGLAPGFGAHKHGVIYSFDPSSNIYSDLYDLNGGRGDGFLLIGSLYLAPDKKFYGLNDAGGTDSGGVLFSFDPAVNSYKVLHNFVKATGRNPTTDKLTQGSDGKLYGTTFKGGIFGFGVIFSFDYRSNFYTDVYDFKCDHAKDWSCGLTLGNDGKLYGTTPHGGTHDGGTIFSFAPSDKTFSTLLNFSDLKNGAIPYAPLVQDSNGLFYGTTIRGGINDTINRDYAKGGTIFCYNPKSKVFSKVYDFDKKHGTIPWGSLTIGANGMLYGTAYMGGKWQEGVVYSFNLSSKSYNLLHEFSLHNGGAPKGDLIEIALK